jgi:hypothetical protein
MFVGSTAAILLVDARKDFDIASKYKENLAYIYVW